MFSWQMVLSSPLDGKSWAPRSAQLQQRPCCCSCGARCPGSLRRRRRKHRAELWWHVKSLCWSSREAYHWSKNHYTHNFYCWGIHFGAWKITSTSTEGQKLHENLAPVLVIISGKSLVFSRKIITSTGFYRYCAPDASAPVVVINESPIISQLHTHTHQLHNFNSRGINLCNACVSLVSACLASMISQKGNYHSQQNVCANWKIWEN